MPEMSDAERVERLLAARVCFSLEVYPELAHAIAKFPPFHSAHEGYAVILEELDELWEEVRKRNQDPVAMRKEAIQVAAMAIRFLTDIGADR